MSITTIIRAAFTRRHILAQRMAGLEAAIQRHHDTRYRRGVAATAVFSPPDIALYETAGTRWNRPPRWHPTPEQREAWRRDCDAAKRERALEAGDAR